MFYSAITYLLEIFLPLSSPLTDQPFLELVYAMLLTSIGSAMIFNANASSGGTDIVALILKKFTSIDVGKALLIVDFFVAASSFFVFGIKTGLYSLLGLFAKAFIVDAVIENLNTCKYFVVITNEREKISEFIIKELHHGVTINAVTGEYTKEEKTMIHSVREIQFAEIMKKQRVNGRFIPPTSRSKEAIAFHTAGIVTDFCKNCATINMYRWHLRKSVRFLLDYVENSDYGIIPDEIIESLELWDELFGEANNIERQKIDVLKFIRKNN